MLLALVIALIEPPSWKTSFFIIIKSKGFLSTKKTNLVKARKFCHDFHFSIIFVPLMIIPSLKRNSTIIILRNQSWKEKIHFHYKHHFSTYQCILRNASLTPLYVRKGMLPHFPLSVFLTEISICHLKYFVHPLPLKFCALLESTLKSLYSSTLQKLSWNPCRNKAPNGSIYKIPE